MTDTAAVEQLRLGKGFPADARGRVLDAFRGQMENQLSRLPAYGFDMELSAKEGNNGNGWRPVSYTLEAWAPGGHRWVATSSLPDERDALNELAGDMRAQIQSTLDRRSTRDRQRARRTHPRRNGG